MNWNKRVKEFRIMRGLSMGKFAKLVGVSAPTVTEWENGTIKTIKGKNLLKAAVVLKVTPECLLTGKGCEMIQSASPAHIVLSPNDRQTLSNAQYLPPPALDALIDNVRLLAEEKHALYTALLAQRQSDETREPVQEPETQVDPDQEPETHTAHPGRRRKEKPDIAKPHSGHHKKRVA